MANGDSSGATQFEFYEGIRIVLPGALAVGLANEISSTFKLGLRLENNPVGGIAAAILIGLIFYYVDAPAKATVYSQNLPTEHLKDLGITTPSGYRLVNLYFVLHDEVVPKGIRARGLYMGSMYRIGLEGIYLLMSSALGTLFAAIILTDLRQGRISSSHPSALPGIVGIIVTVLFVPYAAELEKRRRSSGRTIPGEITSTVREQIGRVDLVVFAICLLLEGAFLFNDHRFLAAGLISAFLVGIGWAVRYFRGYVAAVPDASDHNKSRPHEHIRKPLSRTPAVLTAVIACLFLELNAMLVLPYGKSITTIHYWEWTIIITVALALICARGHERRLGGSYATQNTWLSLNKEELQATYFSGRPPKPIDITSADPDD